MGIFETWFRFGVVAVLLGYSLAQIDQQSEEKSSDNADNKRELNMMRLGRGLQMLRLGKRAVNLDSLGFGRQARSLDSQENLRLSPSEIQAVLDSLFVDSSRQEYRRQPPLPRYGRDNSNNRPAPRGGRYKKSFPLGRFTYGDYNSQDGVNRAGGSFPRLEQILEQMAYIQPKAVSRSRMGRIHNDYTDDSFQA